MRRRAAHVEVLDRRAVLRPAGHGPQEEELLERQLTLEDVASESPHSRSRSSGVTTCRCRMMFLMLGACSAIVSTTVSPKASRSLSQSPLRLYGAYCTKQDMTCLPGGASEGSVSVGMTMSM